jgi:uncharacterized protein (TIGR02147 family)
METQNAYYVTKLKEGLSLRQRENPQYSLRAYARDLGVHPGTLVKVIKGDRPLPVKVSKLVLDKLKLGPKDRTLFMESLLRRKTNIDNIKIDPLDMRFIVDESNYKVIAEWEHFAVTDLFDLPGFEATTEDVAKRFAIPLNRAEVVVHNLILSGLLTMDAEGKLTRVHGDVKTAEDVKSQALKESHIETMKMGINKIEEIEVEFRDFSSMAVGVDLEQLPEAKTIIREFRQKMSALLRNGSNKTDVFQLAIQFYPLTNINKEQD